MIKSFKKELKLIGNNDKFTDKLMLLATYNEFYSDILEITPAKDKDEYREILEKTFKAVVVSFNAKNIRNINTESFMKKYLEKIKATKIYDNNQHQEVISLYENYKKVLKFVPIIDKIPDYSLSNKLNIALQFREYTYNLIKVIGETFKLEYASLLSSELLDMLLEKLDKYLTYCTTNNINSAKVSDNVIPNLSRTTKKVLITKLKTKELKFYIIRESVSLNLQSVFDFLEGRLWLAEFVYDLLNKTGEPIEEETKINEICSLLRINKSKYNLLSLKMKMHILIKNMKPKETVRNR